MGFALALRSHSLEALGVRSEKAFTLEERSGQSLTDVPNEYLDWPLRAQFFSRSRAVLSVGLIRVALTNLIAAFLALSRSKGATLSR